METERIDKPQVESNTIHSLATSGSNSQTRLKEELEKIFITQLTNPGDLN